MATCGDLKSRDSLFCITPTYQQPDPTSPPPPQQHKHKSILSPNSNMEMGMALDIFLL